MKTMSSLQSCALALAVASLTFTSAGLNAAPLNISSVPLFLQESVAPLNMLVLGRDHKLYYEAYNDASDLNPENGRNELDIRYKPAEITYFGYFDSLKCYTYDTAAGTFNPARLAGTNKACGGAGEWSGDFLNYLTTSRIDALRKVLYGGKRSVDNNATAAGSTVLERSHIPMDAHSWGKEYRSTAFDGYDIRQYTPYDQPSGSGIPRHLFANTTPNVGAALWSDETGAPLLRVALNESDRRIWEWVSKESPVAGVGGGGVSIDADLNVRVQVCVTGLLEANCQRYTNGNYKPIGLLQEFGENNSMFFGLLSGSYTANKSGGVLRRTIGSMTDEINLTTGQFKSYAGIIRTLNNLRAAAYAQYTNNGGTSADCNLGNAPLGSQPMRDGECRMWGNPVGEMMYETMRYFAGKSTPTPAFTQVLGTNYTNVETTLNLPRASWDNPYTGRPVCSKPFETVVSDLSVSYDTDQLPGTLFPLETQSQAISDTLSGLDVAARADTISTNEPDVAGLRFIGESLSNTPVTYDGAPSAKNVTSLKNIRGLAPEEPTKQGGYYSASVAYHGAITDINTATGKQKVNTFVVALSSPLPRIEIPVAGRTITLVPFAKSVGPTDYGINPADGNFQPTNQIVDFYVESLTPTSGTFQVNFEDVEAGNDHDMDAIVRYSYSVSGNQVTVTTSSDYAAGGIIQHMGYVISGAADSQNGIYLEVRDRDTSAGNDIDYFLDTPPNIAPSGCRGLPCTRPGDGAGLPLANSRTFDVGNNPAAGILKNPLWYAAKWGGFKDSNNNDLPDVADEWDENGDGTPDNFFLVTNALKLSEQLRAAFDEIIARNASASSASVNSGSVSSDTRVYQAKFNSGTWAGQLLAFSVDTSNGSIVRQEWDAASLIPTANTRAIVTLNSTGVPVPFRWDDIDDTRKLQIDPNYAASAAAETLAENRLNFLRGDASQEQKQGGVFRDRDTRLGDIVSSSPLFVGAPYGSYSATLHSKPFSEFVTENADRDSVVYAGANDGMLHAFDATNGKELFAYVPGAVFNNLSALSSPNYTHKYYVDGPPNVRDVFFNGDEDWHTVLVGGLGAGGQGIYALDITDPDDFSEAKASSLVLWEFDDTDEAGSGVTGDPDLGYTYSQPAIVRLQTGKWAAVFGNGYNNTAADGSFSGTGNAVLYVVDIETGELIRRIDTLTGAAQDPRVLNRPNGLATPSVVDFNSDNKVDYVFAGDLFGNMWKFNITDANPANWRVAYADTNGKPLPLFVARGSQAAAQPDTVTIDQAITSRPEVIRGPRGVGMMILFGTGKYLEASDKIVTAATTEIQTYYGLHDKNTGADTDRIANRTELTKQTVIAEGAQEFKTGDGLVNYRITSSNELALKGWYLDLLSPNGYKGERQVTNTAVRGSRVIFTTLIPDSDPCNFGGSSWLMELEALSGKRLQSVPYDMNNDGKFDDNDKVDGMIVSGLQPSTGSGSERQTVGIIPDAGILFGSSATREYIYTPGTTGDIALTVGSADPRAYGRQSWRQVR